MASETLFVDTTVSVLGKSYKQRKQITYDGAVPVSPTLGLAKTGTLTTRTSASVGTLTMATGHGITNGAIVSIFWDGGSRRNVLVGTVATNSVPFTLGTGDDLPLNNTVVTVMVQHPEDFVVTGDNLVGLVLTATGRGWIVVTESDLTTVLYSYEFEDDTGGTVVWENTNGADNPLAGAVTAKVLFTAESSEVENNMKIIGLYA